LLSAALVLQGIKDDDQSDAELRAAAVAMKRRWSKINTAKRPSPIGKADDDRQADVYRAADLCDWLAVVERAAVARIGGEKPFLTQLKRRECNAVMAVPS